MSSWDYEHNKKIVEQEQKLKVAATAFLNASLSHNYGNTEDGLKAIGTERFNELVVALMKMVPYPKTGGKQ